MMHLEADVFRKFDKQWALVTAGTPEHYNTMTISWGGLGTLWRRPVATVYVKKNRYTFEFMEQNDYFTVSFYPDQYRKALGYMGGHSGRDGDKAAAAGLTPVAIGDGVTYEEANLTFLCKKLYQHQFVKEDLAPEIQEYYASMPKVYPDFKGGWQPHIVFVGQILGVEDKR